MNRTLAPLLLALFGLPLFAACQATVTVDGDGNNPDGTEGPCTDVCDAYPSCAPDEYEVPSCAPGDPSCRTSTVCCTTISCERGGTECLEPPYCYSGYQVDSCPSDAPCYEVSACGQTIYCLEEVFCDGYPSCDPGDTEVNDCPADAGCYTAELCGSTILCMDDYLPEHGCPQVPPSVGTACDPGSSTMFCDYPTSQDCFESYGCQQNGNTFTWDFVGGGCAGNPGG